MCSYLGTFFTSEICSIQICRAVYFDHKGGCHIGHYLRYHGDAVDATRHVVRTPEGIYSRGFCVIHVIRRRGCTSYLVDEKTTVEEGHKKEVVASPLLQQNSAVLL